MCGACQPAYQLRCCFISIALESSAGIKNPSPLRIVADEALAKLELLAGNWCTVQSMPGREISAADAAQADVLLLRSVTQVDSALLEHSAVQFIGTATIGTDHIDTSLLSRRGIGFAHAPGCNANAVVDYVLSAILAELSLESLQHVRVGIVGCGNVGGRLLACLTHFGLQCTVYDPLVEPGLLSIKYNCKIANSFDQLLDCNIVSLHVPLTRTGKHATWHMLKQPGLERLPAGALLINTSRGAVIDNQALLQVAGERPDLRLVLDVFEHEPCPDHRLVARANYATPHIAGYSAAGKERGTGVIVAAMLAYFAANPPSHCCILPRSVASLPLDCIAIQQLATLVDLAREIERICPLATQSLAFKTAFAAASGADRGTLFDHSRRNYPLRSEIDYAPLNKSVSS